MDSYNYDNSYYPPLQNASFERRGSPHPSARQPQQGYSAPPALPHTQSYQNPSYNPYIQQSPPLQAEQVVPYQAEPQEYNQGPFASSPRASYQMVGQSQQPTHLAPPQAPMAPGRSSSRDRNESYDNALRAPAYERRQSTQSTRSQRSTHSTRSHRSSHSTSGRSTRSGRSNSGRHYVTRDGEVIDMDRLDKSRSYGDSVVNVWNALKGAWSRKN